jgi:hypothetical protein
MMLRTLQGSVEPRYKQGIDEVCRRVCDGRESDL